jgi:eukaryotic-like serine/threonine-protein kinase
MTTFRLGGVAEVAELLSVSRQRVAKLRERPDFPDPVGELAQGAVWDLDAVEAWNGSGLRQSGGRPTSAVASRTLGGRFILEEPKIGRGGFADVYKARDKKRPGPSDYVAVKVLHDIAALDPEAIRRFKRELRLLEALEHPNVIQVIASGDTADEGVWYAMPLAQGSLADSIEEFGGKDAQILDLMRQVCAGLAHVHDEGIYHRDLKPGNILRTADGGWAISDFGLAVEVERNTTVLTSTLRAGLGSYWYTAPEQWKQARSADERSDIFSLGKILQELVTGEYPIGNEMPASTLRPVVEKATSNNPAQRFPNAAAFLAAVERAIATPDERWETPEDVAKRLFERVRLPKPAAAALEEFFTWAQGLDENDTDDMRALTQVLPWISSWSIGQLWADDSGSFTRVFERFADHVSQFGFEWGFCDVLADFIRQAIEITENGKVLRSGVRALAELGERHNRWHVRDVLTSVLQSVRSGEDALVAVEGLRAVAPSTVRWSINDFSLRSLHPVLRTGIESYVDQEKAS